MDAIGEIKKYLALGVDQAIKKGRLKEKYIAHHKYIHKITYQKTMPRKKKAPTRGGSRPGCGAKIKGTAPRVKISFTPGPGKPSFSPRGIRGIWNKPV